MLVRSEFAPTAKGENRDSPLWKPHRERSPRSGVPCLLCRAIFLVANSHKEGGSFVIVILFHKIFNSDSAKP